MYNERQRRWFEAQSQVLDFIRPIHSKAEDWLRRDVYPSQEYKELARRLQKNELDFAHQVLTHMVEDLGLIELIRHNPTIREDLGKIMEPLATSSAPVFRRIIKILEWDMKIKPTDFLKLMYEEGKTGFEEEVQRDPLPPDPKESIAKAQNLATQLIISRYSKHEGIARVILTDQN